METDMTITFHNQDTYQAGREYTKFFLLGAENEELL